MSTRKKNAQNRRKLRINSRMKQKCLLGRDRLVVFRSNRHITAQVIDSEGKVLSYASTMDKSLYKPKVSLCNTEYAFKVGELLINNLKQSNHSLSLLFDRNGYKYHGIIKNVADGARSAGTSF